MEFYLAYTSRWQLFVELVNVILALYSKGLYGHVILNYNIETQNE